MLVQRFSPLIKGANPATGFVWLDPDAPEETSEPKPRLGSKAEGWLERLNQKSREIQRTLKESESGWVRFLRRIWNWLYRIVPLDEPLLMRLRTTPELTLCSSDSSESHEELLTDWKRYLKRRRRKEWFWFVFNTALSPFSVLLTPVPGPNLIGYWFVYRAVCHFLTILGVRRALSGGLPTSVAKDKAHAVDDV